MSKPFIHAKSSAKKFGGLENDYLEIHNLMDSSKSIIADNRHRMFTHNSWFISTIIERIFGNTIINSDGIEVSTREIAEQHVLEDFGNFIPTGQDYIEELQYKEWMNGNGNPQSRIKVVNTKSIFIPFNND
jgi:hypothetical protein